MAYPYQTQTPTPFEKLIAVASYITFGLIGFIWILIGVFTKKNLKHFLKYHIYQSIFISILLFIVSMLLNIILNILSFIPFINTIIGTITWFLNMPILFHLSIMNIIILIIIAYLSLGALKGAYSYLPWVSNIIRYNVDRS